MPNLKDIAKRAGTSVSTVSLVLNNRDAPIRISKTTREQVLEAARAVGYTPNVAARRLRANRDKLLALTIGILMPFDERLHISSRAIAGIHATLNKWAVTNSAAMPDMIIETYEKNKLKEVSSLKENSSYNGVILLNTSPEDDIYLEKAGPFSIPIVVIQRSIKDQNWVNIDNREMGRQVALHLTGQGHKTIGIIIPSLESNAVTERLEGFQEYLGNKFALKIEKKYCSKGAFSEKGGYEATSQLIKQLKAENKVLPTALFVLNDVMAVGALHALKENGLRIPKDISIVGYDNDPVASFTDPPLTTVESIIDQSAETAADTLLNLILGKITGPVTKLFEARLIIRGSSSPPVNN